MTELIERTLLEQLWIMLPLIYWIIGFNIYSLLLIYITLVFRDRKWIKNPKWQTEVAREKIREQRQENKKLTEENEQLGTENISMWVAIRQVQNVVGAFYSEEKRLAIEDDKKAKKQFA